MGGGGQRVRQGSPRTRPGFAPRSAGKLGLLTFVGGMELGIREELEGMRARPLSFRLICFLPSLPSLPLSHPLSSHFLLPFLAQAFITRRVPLGAVLCRGAGVGKAGAPLVGGGPGQLLSSPQFPLPSRYAQRAWA